LRKRLVGLFFLIISVALSGCGMSKEEAREELGKLNIDYSPNAFVEAAKNNDMYVLDLFLKSGINPNKNSNFGENALYEAAKNENLEIVKTLTDYGADPTMKDESGANALIYAAVTPTLKDVLELFLQVEKLDINKTALGMSPAMAAAEAANLKGFSLITKKKINTNVRDDSGETLLHKAVKGGDTEIIKEVLSMDIDPNITNSKGITPLALAVEKGQLNTVKLLLKKKADPNVKSTNGGTLLTFSYSNGYSEISKELRKAGAKQISLLVYNPTVESKEYQVKNTLGAAPTLKMDIKQGIKNDISFNLNKGAAALTFYYSNSIGGWGNSHFSNFKIIGDNKVLLDSKNLPENTKDKRYTVDLFNVKQLTISTEGIGQDAFFWGESIFTNPLITLIN
jgi:ankyrin repeat protein